MINVEKRQIIGVVDMEAEALDIPMVKIDGHFAGCWTCGEKLKRGDEVELVHGVWWKLKTGGQ